MPYDMFFTRHLKERLFKYNSYFLHNNGICQRGAMVQYMHWAYLGFMQKRLQDWYAASLSFGVL